MENKFLLMLNWLISFYHFLFPVQSITSKKWLQKLVKKKSSKKKTPHLSWTREDRCIQRHLQLFSLLVKVSSSTNHHGFQYLISEVMCCLHPFATLVENRICLNWKKKRLKSSNTIFPMKNLWPGSRVCSGWVSENKTLSPQEKSFGWIFPYRKWFI